MKKILTTLAISGLTVAAFAQGTVNWTAPSGLFIGNVDSTHFSSFFGGGNTGSGTVGATPSSSTSVFYYELLTSTSLTTAPTTISGLGSWLDTGLEAQNSAAANGRVILLGSANNAIANNWPAGNTQNIIMVGWSANLGTTWSAALSALQNWNNSTANAFFGVGTSVGNETIGSGNVGITVLGVGTGAGTTQINDAASNPLVMQLLPTTVVPEPGTMALAAVGGLSLLAFRRKK